MQIKMKDGDLKSDSCDMAFVSVFTQFNETCDWKPESFFFCNNTKKNWKSSTKSQYLRVMDMVMIQSKS